MAYLTVTKILLTYEVPLIVLAKDTSKREYVGVNYDDSESGDGHKFYFARVRAKTTRELTDGTWDVLYAVTKKKIGRYELGVTWGQLGDQVETKSREALQADWLPKPGMFMPEAKSSRSHRIVKIDGRWGIEDLKKFSNLVQDCYAFVVGLNERGSTGTVKQQVEALFHRYPWRRGFSTVNFFDDLYRLIPQTQRVSIQRIQYASPGHIEFKINPTAADAMRRLVQDINSDSSIAAAEYKRINDWMRDNGWLGHSADDLGISSRDKAALMEELIPLAKSLGLEKQSGYILSLAQEDPLAAVKILLSYYRRLSSLADYVATGKAQDLFSKIE